MDFHVCCNVFCWFGCYGCVDIRLESFILIFLLFLCVSGKIDNFESEASLKIKDKRGGMESEFLVCCWFRVDLAGR